MKQILTIMSMILLSIFMVGCQDQIAENKSEVQTIETKQSLTPTADNFLKVLLTDKDGKEYLEKYPRTKITNFKKINPEDFENLKNQTQYKDLYVNLPQKELYYVEFNGGSALSIATIIDLQDEKVIKIFGIYIMGMG